VSRKNSHVKQSFFLVGETSKALNINDLRRRAPPRGVTPCKLSTYRIYCSDAVPSVLSSTKKIFFNCKKIPCIFARLCYSLSMTEKEKEIQALEEKLEQIANDLIDPMLDDQTTVLLRAMRKVREKINALVAE